MVRITYQTIPPPSTNTPNNHKWLRILGIIIAVLVGFVVIIFAVVTLTTNEPQKVSDKFVQSIQNKEYNSAYALVTDSFKNQTSQQSLENFINKLPSAGQAKIIGKKISAYTNTGTIAVFVYQITGGDNVLYYLKVEVKKVGNDWQILNVRSSETELDTTVE